MREKEYKKSTNPLLDISDLRKDRLNTEFIDALNSTLQEGNIPVGISIIEINGEYTVESKGYRFNTPFKPLFAKERNEKLIVESGKNTVIEKICLEYINSSTDKDRAISKIYAIYYALMDVSCDKLNFGLCMYTSMLYALTTTARNASKYFRGTLFEEMVTKRKKFIRPIRDMWKLNGISINKYV